MATTNNNKGNSGNTGGGTETSFTKTPQAKDDALGSTSSTPLNYTSTVYQFDVMANDLGGNAKSLWSVDDGINQSGAMSGYEAGDLLTQDAPGVTGVAANRSKFGAALSITSNGRVAYDVSTIDAAIAASLTALSLGSTMTDSFIYAIRLANGTLSWAKANVTLTGVNDTPTVQSVSLAATEDGGPVTVGFVGDDVDSDDDGSSLTYTINGSPALGTLSNNGLSFTYDPGANFQSLAQGQTDVVTLSYTATDRHGAVSAPASLTITVTGVNDAPTLAAAAIGITEDGSAVTLDLSALGADIDSDNDGSNLTYTLLNGPAGGSAAIIGTTLTVNPGAAFQALALGQTSTYELQVQATDVHGASAVNTVTVTVTGVNDAPTLAGTAVGITEDGSSASVDLAALGDDVDSDNDGTNLSYALLNGPAGGSAAISGTTLTVDPATAFQQLAMGETASFDLQVEATDVHGAKAVNTVAVTVTGVNDAPTISGVTITLMEDGQPAHQDLSYLANDVDSDDALPQFMQYSILSGPDEGVAQIGGTVLSVTTGYDYQWLALGQTVTDEVQVQVMDSHGATDSATVTLVISGANDAPTLAGAAVAISEDGAAATLDLSALGADVDSDNDGSNLTYSLLNGPAAGSAGISGTTLTVDPSTAFQSLAAGQTSQYTLQLQATDAHGATAGNSVTVTVTGKNDAPVIQGSSELSGALTATAPVVPFTVQQYSNARSTVLSDLVNYAANNAATRTVTTAVIDYTDDPAGFAGEIPGSMPWPVAQAAGATGTSHPLNDNFFVRITGQVDVATADTYTFRTFNDDGVFLKVNNTLIINDPGIHPEVSREGSIALAPGQYPIELYFFEYGGEASLEFTYRNSTGSYGLVDLNPLLKDSGAIQFHDVDLTDTHSVAVAPVGSTLGSLSTVLVSDTTGNGTGGQVTWNYSVDKSALTYLAQGETRVETFTVTVADGQGGSDSRDVQIVLTGINDRAVLGNAVVDLVETNAPLTTGGTLSISDADAGQAQFVPVSNMNGSFGVLNMDAAGAWTYTTNSALDFLSPGQVVTEVFTVNSVDATSTTITVNITGTVDGPTAVDDSNSLTASTVVPDTSNTVYWVDWQDVEVIGGTVGIDKLVRVTGTITLGDGHTIGVAYEGLSWMVLLGQGQSAPELNSYSSPTSEFIEPNALEKPYTSAQVNAPTTWDIVGLNEAFTGGGFQTGGRTDYSPRNLSFSEPVENLFFAVMSMNSNGYLFDQNFQIVSQGQGKYGNAPDISPTSFGDGRYGIVSGGEFHGVLKIDGSVEDLSWTSQNKETWNGFTVGTYGQSRSASVSGNVLTNDVPPAVNALIEVSNVGGQAMVGNSVTVNVGLGATLRVDRDGDYFFDDKGAYASLNAGEFVDEQVQYTVRDAQGNTDTAVFSIRINGANDAPTAVNDGFNVNEDTPITLFAQDLLSNDTDRDTNDGKALVSVQGAVNGTVALNAGVVTFTPASNFVGNASFTYTMQDAGGLSSTATVNLTVTPVSDTYVVSNVVSNGSFENGTTGWTVLAGGVDVVPSTGWQSADGSYSIDVNAFQRGGVSQVLSTVPGQTYLVGFELSQNPGAVSSTLRVSAGSTVQDFVFNADSTETNMQWANRTISFVAAGTSTTLSFESLTPNTPQGFPGDAQGPALDEVVVLQNRVITGFVKGANSDVLNLQSLLTSVNAPHDATAFSNGFVRFLASGADTVVQIDADGGGNDYLTAVTLTGVNLTQSDTASYIL